MMSEYTNESKCMESQTTKVLLYSGGMDSFIVRHLYKPDICLYVDLKTKYSLVEIARLDNRVTLVEFPGLGKFERKDGIIPLRNLFLVCVGALHGNEIALGATAGDRILDKSYEFAMFVSLLLTYLWQPDHWTRGKKVRVVLPVKELTKVQLVKRFLDEGGRSEDLVDRSFSCYKPDKQHRACGECKPCYRKWVALTLNNIDMRESKTYEFIKREIVPLINSGTYGRKEESREILDAISFYERGLLGGINTI